MAYRLKYHPGCKRDVDRARHTPVGSRTTHCAQCGQEFHAKPAGRQILLTEMPCSGPPGGGVVMVSGRAFNALIDCSESKCSGVATFQALKSLEVW